jgi:hypothetical protein
MRFDSRFSEAAVFRIDTAKTFAFAKRPHGQTAFTSRAARG